MVRVSELGRHQCSSAARDAGMLCASRVQERAGQPAMGRTGGGAAAVLCCCVSAHARRLGVVKSAAMAPRTGAVPNTRQKERQGHVHRTHRFPTPASPPCRAARTSHPTPRRPAVGGVGTWHSVLIGTRLLTVSCLEGPSNPYARRYYLNVEHRALETLNASMQPPTRCRQDAAPRLHAFAGSTAGCAAMQRLHPPADEPSKLYCASGSELLCVIQQNPAPSGKCDAYEKKLSLGRASAS